MDRKELFDRIGGVIEESAVEEVDWTQVTEATEIDTFGFDSLSVLDLLFDLEQEFGVEIEAKEILNIKTVGQMITFLGERMSS